MKSKDDTKLWYVILLCLALTYIPLGLFLVKTKRQSPDEQKVVVLLPNQGQLQEILNAIEPNNPLKVDHVVGTDSRDKWDRIAGNAYAAPYHTPSGAPTRRPQ